MKPSAQFPRMDKAFAAARPVYALSPPEAAEAHRFYDSPPLDPSGRLLAVTRFPFEDRLPQAGDHAEVVVRDLRTGATVFHEETGAWDTQLGAQPQWGPEGQVLYFNTLAEDGRPRAVRVDLATGQRRVLGGSVYGVAPDGRRLASPDLRRIGTVQAGYGVVGTPVRNTGAPEDDGVWITDTGSGRADLAVSLRRLVRQAGLGDPDTGSYHVFHVKWNPTGDRLLVVVRWIGAAGEPARRWVLACDPDGGRVRTLVNAALWARGGHHPNWLPDGRAIIMNLRPQADGPLRFVQVPDADAPARILAPGAAGSGHPTLAPDGRHILTDAYLHEPLAEGDHVPLRWIDAASGRESALAIAPCRPAYAGPAREWRIDPHPAWTRDGRAIVFGARIGPHRGVFLMELC